MSSHPNEPERSNAAEAQPSAQDRYEPAKPGRHGPDRDNERAAERHDTSDTQRSSAGPQGATDFRGTGTDRDNERTVQQHQVPEPEGSSPGPYGATDFRATATDHDSVRAREKEAFGGIKIGSAFFGWLTTIGATLLLIAIASAIAAGIGVDTSLSSQDLRGVGIGVAIALLVILFISYFVGGYVAGRMARFNGARQGLAVWLWAVLVAVILTVVGVIAGQQTDITSQLNLPSIPVSSDDLTAGGLIGLAILLTVTLVAAILGGLAGMRFHRRVDRAGFDTSNDTEQLDRH